MTEWKKWEGRPCPPDTIVDVDMGKLGVKTGRADSFNWAVVAQWRVAETASAEFATEQPPSQTGYRPTF